MKTIKFKTSIHCGGCIKSVTPFLNSLDNVDSWKVDLENSNKILEVTIDNDDEKSVIDAVKKAGFEIEPLEA
jgi:copper chaperone